MTAINTTRRILLTGGLFLAAGMCIAAYDATNHDAQAADKPAHAAEHPGGMLDHPLPEQASDRAREVLDQLLPEPPSAPPAEPAVEPTPELKPTAEPEPANQPAEDEARASEPASDPIIELPPIDVTPIDVAPTVTDEPATEDPPAAVEPAPEPAPTADLVLLPLPSADPAPLPNIGGLLEPILRTPAAAPVVVVAAPPAEPDAPEPAPDPPADDDNPQPPQAAPTEHSTPDCDNPPDVVRVDRDLIRQLVDSLTTAADTSRTGTGQHCGHTPPPPAPDAVSQQPPNGKPAADITTAPAIPGLDRIAHTRARSSIPTGRHVAVEPGPA